MPMVSACCRIAVLRRSLILAALACLVAQAARSEQVPARSPDEVIEFPQVLVDFAPYEKNPVFTPDNAGHWDARIRERGWILHEGELYRMWFTGYDGTRAGIRMLGYATSRDGLAWKRHSQNPIYREHWVEDMMVVRRNGTYYMFSEGLHDHAQLHSSNDGMNWKRHGTLDIRQVDGQPLAPGPFGTPTAWFEDSVWYLFYERRDAAVWLATSKDLKTWTNVQDEPVLHPGPAYYDERAIALNQIIQFDGRYYAYYHGIGPRTNGNWTTNVATSSDLVHWIKYPRNPLVPVDTNQSSGIVVDDGSGMRLYTMHDQVRVHLPRNPSPRN
jgi:predicted GH43/DUF377 family glycosyl hydrolase